MEAVMITYPTTESKSADLIAFSVRLPSTYGNGKEMEPLLAAGIKIAIHSHFNPPLLGNGNGHPEADQDSTSLHVQIPDARMAEFFRAIQAIGKMLGQRMYIEVQ